MKTIGLALGGGAGLGWAHIGVVRALERDYGLRPRHIAGTSIGSIVGGGIAAGLLDRVEEVARSLDLRDMLSLGELGFGRGALIGTGKIADQLAKVLGDRQIEDLALPFAAVSTDLYTGETHIHDRGPLIEALRASSAIPAVFPAVPVGDKLLVDGGVVEPVPVDACRSLGAERVIAVNLQDDYQGSLERIGIERGKTPSVLKLGRAAVVAGIRTVARQSLAASMPDLVISPKIGGYDPSDFTKAGELITLGEAAVDASSDALEALVRNL